MTTPRFLFRYTIRQFEQYCSTWCCNGVAMLVTLIHSQKACYKHDHPLQEPDIGVECELHLDASGFSYSQCNWLTSRQASASGAVNASHTPSHLYVNHQATCCRTSAKAFSNIFESRSSYEDRHCRSNQPAATSQGCV